ncbi:MAG TPA: (2Fe-2S)-binding protein [Thermoanaerobaculia bacterium]|nr:(2Fe-2S)-binding protein [Thermoanaerobaculia bacterium]
MDESPSLHPAVRGLKTVCRCNNIKYRTLERAIRDGAQTIDEVSRRTGATTGHCGGTCTPDVLAMIAEISGAAPCLAQPQACASNAADAWWVRKK